MHSAVNSRDLLKWSVIAIKAVSLAAAVIPKLKQTWDEEVQRQPKHLVPIPTGQFGLLLLDEHGSVISTHRFSRLEVRVGYVNKLAVQEAVISAGADSAVMTYESPGLMIDKPKDYRDVIRELFDALAEIDVRLLNRGLVDVEHP